MDVLKFEFKKLLSRKEFNIVLMVKFILICVAFIYAVLTLYKFPSSEIPSAYQLWICQDGVNFVNYLGDIYALFLITLPVCIAYADTYLEDRKEKVFELIITRCKKEIYILCKAICVFLSGFIIVFFPLLLHQILCIIALPLYSISEATNGLPVYRSYFLSTQLYFFNIHVKNPYLHNILYMFLDGLFGGIVAIFSYSLSFLKKINRYVVIILPTVLFLTENFVAAVLHKANFSLGYYLSVTTNVVGMNYNIFSFSLIVLIMISVVIILTNVCRDDIE